MEYKYGTMKYGCTILGRQNRVQAFFSDHLLMVRIISFCGNYVLYTNNTTYYVLKIHKMFLITIYGQYHAELSFILPADRRKVVSISRKYMSSSSTASTDDRQLSV